jgi:hypothetical protein
VVTGIGRFVDKPKGQWDRDDEMSYTVAANAVLTTRAEEQEMSVEPG